jgi:hypothetical protein
MNDLTQFGQSGTSNFDRLASDSESHISAAANQQNSIEALLVTAFPIEGYIRETEVRLQ